MSTTDELRRLRNRHLIEAANLLAPGSGAHCQARVLARRLKLFFAEEWPQFKEQDEPPQNFGEIEWHLFHSFKTGQNIFTVAGLSQILRCKETDR